MRQKSMRDRPCIICQLPLPLPVVLLVMLLLLLLSSAWNVYSPFLPLCSALSREMTFSLCTLLRQVHPGERLHASAVLLLAQLLDVLANCMLQENLGLGTRASAASVSSSNAAASAASTVGSSTAAPPTALAIAWGLQVLRCHSCVAWISWR